MLYSFEDFSLDTARRELRRSGTLISLQPQVFDLLEYLIRNRERVVDKDDLLAAVWNGRIVSESTLSTRINAARSAIGDSGDEQRLLRTAPTKRIPLPCTVRIRRCSSPLSPIALRAALIRVLNVDSETMRPLHTAASKSSLLTTRSRFRIEYSRRSKT